ncbi:MAG TPA: hypothetical protein VF037_09060, partial [Gemmatimonadales bacterium]
MRRLTFLLALGLAAPLAGQDRAAAPGARPGASPADRAAAAVSGTVMQAHLEFLADDLLEGR